MKIFLRRRHAITVADGAVSHKIDYGTIVLKILFPKGPSKLHYWFKSYDDFAEWVDFAHWWSSIGKGLRLQPVQQACLQNDLFHFDTIVSNLLVWLKTRRGSPIDNRPSND